MARVESVKAELAACPAANGGKKVMWMGDALGLGRNSPSPSFHGPIPEVAPVPDGVGRTARVLHGGGEVAEWAGLSWSGGMSSSPDSAASGSSEAGWAVQLSGAPRVDWGESSIALAGGETRSGGVSRGTDAVGREWHRGERLRVQTSGLARLPSLGAEGAPWGFPAGPRSRIHRRAGAPGKGQLADSRPSLGLLPTFCCGVEK